MKKWWRRFKNKHGWDFTKIGTRKSFMTRLKGQRIVQVWDDNGIYLYVCRYCGRDLKFPWKETNLAYHNMQRHIKAKHIDVL